MNPKKLRITLPRRPSHLFGGHVFTSVLATVFATVVTSVFGAAGCTPHDARASSPAAVSAPASASASSAAPLPVRLAAIVRARRTRPVQAAATLNAKEEVKLSFKLGGLVERIFVEEGASVRSGQRLAALRLPEIDAGVAQAREGLVKAERDLARVQALFEGKAATLEQSQNASTAVDVARATLAAVTFNREHAVIDAPADGKIVRRLVEKDETVPPGAPIFVFRSTRRGWVVRAGVADRDVVRLGLGDSATVRFGAWPERAFAATVTEIAESASPTTGTYELELRLKETDPAFRTGLLGEVALQPAAKEAYAFVPLTALQEGEGHTASVWVPSADHRHAEKRTVAVAFLEPEPALAAVGRGLEGASEVIVEGGAQLAAGSPIAVAAAEKAQTP